MISGFGPSRIFRKDKDSQSSISLYPGAEAKDSKAQHILGLSRTELNSARVQSRNSKLPAVIHQQPVVTRPKANLQGKQPNVSIKSQPSFESTTILVNKAHVAPETVSISEVSSLDRYSSNSTLRSFYDVARVSTKISEQTSNSSSREFALRKGNSSILPSRDQVMGHARHLKLFRLSKRQTRASSADPESKTLKHNSGPLMPNVVHTPTSVDANRGPHSSPPTRPMKIENQRQPLTDTPHGTLDGETSEIAHDAIHNPSNTTTTLQTPYAKINVRKPKAGARNWFDDLDEDTGDEAAHKEPVLRQNYVTEVERAFQDGRIGTTVPSSRDDDKEAVGPQARPLQLTNAASHATLKAIQREEGVQSRPKGNGPLVEETRKPRTRKPNPLSVANLTEESILYLSSSEEEEDGGNVQATPRIRTSRSAPQIRASLAVSPYEGSDIEIGEAQPVKTSDLRLQIGSSRVQWTKDHSSGYAASPLSASSASLRRHVNTGNPTPFYHDEKIPVEDAEESELISSFPATPVESKIPRKPSARSSVCVSDDSSFISTRMMQVTKQEQNLIAAMRLKKASMKRAEKDRDRNRRAALKVLETAEKIVVPVNEVRYDSDDQARLDYRLSNRYSPSMRQTNQAEHYTRESVTTFQTESQGYRNSQATFMSNFSDGNQTPEPLPAPQPRRNIRLPIPNLDQHLTGAPASPANGYAPTRPSHAGRQDEDVVRLDNLDTSMRRVDIPSQLFMESPFVGWERAELGLAHS